MQTSRLAPSARSTALGGALALILAATAPTGARPAAPPPPAPSASASAASTGPWGSTATSSPPTAAPAATFLRDAFELGPLGYRVGAVELVDLDRNGLDDLVVVDEPPRDMRIYMSAAHHGSIDFYLAATIPVPGGRDVVGYDLDPLDGLMDLVLAVESGPAGGVYVYENAGLVRDALGRPVPTFAPPVRHGAAHAMHMPYALAVGNLNGDERLGRPVEDLVMGQTNHEVGVALAGRGSSSPYTFLPYVGHAQQYFPRELAVGDFDGDGANDIAYAGGTQAFTPGLGVTWNERSLASVVLPHPALVGASLGFAAPRFTSGQRLPFHHLTGAVHQHAVISDLAVVDVDGDHRQDLVFSTHLVSGHPATALPIQIFLNGGSRVVDPLAGAVYAQYGAPGSYLLAALREPGEFVHASRAPGSPALVHVRRALAPVDDADVPRGPSPRPVLALLTGECDGRPGTDVVLVSGDVAGTQQYVEFYARR